MTHTQTYRDIVEFLKDGHARKKYATLLHALVYLPQMLERSSTSPELIASIRAGNFDGKYAKLFVNFSKGETYFGVENFNYRDFVLRTSKAIKDYLKVGKAFFVLCNCLMAMCTARGSAHHG